MARPPRTLLYLLLLLAAPAACAEETAPWQVRIAPYLWGSALSGHLAHAQLPLDVNARLSFGDIWDNLDFGAMGTLEARRGRVGVLADVLAVDLSSTGPVPVPALGAEVPVDVGSRTRTSLLAFEYQVWSHGDSLLDLVAGARWWSVRTRLSYALPVAPPPPLPQVHDGTQSGEWIDVQLGLKGRHEFGNGWYVGGWALAGPGGSHLSTDAMLMAGYHLNERFALVAGYRWLTTDYSANGFRFDTSMQGPGAGIEYLF